MAESENSSKKREVRTNIIKGIIIIITGLLGGSIAFLVHYIFTGLTDAPVVQIQEIPEINNSGHVVIRVTNDGKVPVTNLNLTIKVPNGINITNFSNLTSVQSTWEKVNATEEEAHVHKLIQGTGSIIYISIPIKKNHSFSCNGFSVYAVYDQGSVQGHCVGIFDLIYQFNILHNSIKIGILVALIIFVSTGLLLFIQKYVVYLYMRRRKKAK